MLGMMYTAQQNTYVESPLEGHKKVIAVPGSGKSTGLLGRISYLIDNGVNPRTIVALMFSTSAKKSFEKKLKSSSASMGKVSTYTFNGIGLRLLKRFASHGIIPELKILGESAQNIAFRNLCRSALAHVGLPKFDGKLFEELVAASKSDIIPV